MIRSIRLDVTGQAEKDPESWGIPSEVYQGLTAQSTAASNYTNELMAGRFTEGMSRVEPFMWKSMDKCVAAFLPKPDRVILADLSLDVIWKSNIINLE